MRPCPSPISTMIGDFRSPADFGGEGGGIVHVAVSKSTEKGALLIKWTAAKFTEREICVVHVHKVSKKIPTLLGNMPVSGANAIVVAAHRKEEWEQTKKILKYYESVCLNLKVKMSTMVIESEQVHKGIVDLVNENKIGKLVMGAVSVTWLNVKSKSKSSYIAKNASSWCEIWFINKDKHLWTRDAVELIHSVLQVVHPMTLNPDTRILETLPYNITVKRFWSNSDSVCSNKKLEEEGLYNKLMKVNKEVEAFGDVALDELLRLKKAVAESREAIRKTDACEFAHALEIDRKREAEDMLKCIKRKQDKVSQNKEEALREVKIVNGSVATLESDIEKSTGEEWPSYVARRLADLGLKFCELNSRDRPQLTPNLMKELERLQFVEERPVPCFFQCPISKELMHDPQIAADGFSYDGDSLREWLNNGRDTSPMTNLRLSRLELTPNHALRHAIQDWMGLHYHLLKLLTRAKKNLAAFLHG